MALHIHGWTDEGDVRVWALCFTGTKMCDLWCSQSSTHGKHSKTAQAHKHFLHRNNIDSLAFWLNRSSDKCWSGGIDQLQTLKYWNDHKKENTIQADMTSTMTDNLLFLCGKLWYVQYWAVGISAVAYLKSSGCWSGCGNACWQNEVGTSTARIHTVCSLTYTAYSELKFLEWWLYFINKRLLQ